MKSTVVDSYKIIPAEAKSESVIQYFLDFNKLFEMNWA